MLRDSQSNDLIEFRARQGHQTCSGLLPKDIGDETRNLVADL
jgi:hypothetical protein